MRYENSLTSNVHNYIAETLAKKIQAAQSGMELNKAARDIRGYLCDQSTLSTPDFVIRRFLQANQNAILPNNADIPNLLESKNVPWSSEVITSISADLAKLSKERGTKIEKKTWIAYLSGKQNPQNREMVFRIAFSIDMDVDTTIDLLLASDLESYSARYPLDLICLFCQRTPGKYSWGEVCGMLEEFTRKSTNGFIGTNIPSQGMTRQISSNLDAIFAKNLPDADAKGTLINYMVSNSAEFPCYKKTVERAVRDKNGKIIKDNEDIEESDENGKIVTTTKKVTRKEIREEAHYLEGFSLGRMEKFIRLTEYLAVLFPYYGAISPIDYENDGSPKLQSLVRSMFFNCELAELFPKADDQKKKSKKKPDTKPKKLSTTKDEKFNEVMRQLLQNYEAHMTAISKLREKLSDANVEVEQVEHSGKDDFVSFFSRQDALFLIYFFIIGYRNLLALYFDPDCIDDSELNHHWKKDFSSPEESIERVIMGKKSYPTPRQIHDRIMKDMFWSGNPFDEAMALVMSNIEYIYFDIEEIDDTETQFNYLSECFNIILAQMDYMNLYLPARFDRFVILSLLSGNPTELTPLIICQVQHDHYEGSNQFE